MTKRPASRKAELIVRVLSGASRRGRLQYGSLNVACALGRSGVAALKHEGDGASPRGTFTLRRVLYNAAQVSRPRSALPVSRISKDDGWCDSPRDRNYNRPVRLPYPASAERLCRDDGLYDLVVVVGYNEVPRVKNRGSAIFMHVARRSLPPTEGCIALRRGDLLRLLARVPRGTQLMIGA